MALPTTYRKEKEGVLANYSYVDIAEGTGSVIYQGYNSGISGSTAFYLGDVSIASHDIETEGGDTGIGKTYTFDMSDFNLPKTVKGTAFVRFTCYQYSATGSSSFFDVTIYKVDAAGTASSLATERTEILNGGAGAELTRNITIPLTIALTHFKKGDHIRVTLAGTGQGTWYLGHDPINRDGTKISDSSVTPTKFEVSIPYKIDL